VTTPYHGYVKNLLIAALGKLDSHMDPLWEGGHIKFFSVDALGKLVASHGFRRVELDVYGRLPLLWKSMICTALKEG
jgi:hypothetical protein